MISESWGSREANLWLTSVLRCIQCSQYSATILAFEWYKVEIAGKYVRAPFGSITFFFLQSTFLTDSTQHVFPHLICDLIYKEIWPCQRRQLKKTKCLWDSAKALGEKWCCGALWFCKPRDVFQPLGFIFLLHVGATFLHHSLPQNQNTYFFSLTPLNYLSIGILGVHSALKRVFFSLRSSKK